MKTFIHNRSIIACIALSVILLAACNHNKVNDGDITQPANNGGTAGTGAPVETAAKVAPNQAPAFDGQTRVGSVKTTTAIKVSIITSSLSYPWGLAFLPDGRMLVTEKPGRIRIVTTSGAIGNPITGVPLVSYAGESGLLSIALDPDFATSRMVFWTFTETVTGGVTMSVAKGKLSADETAFENVQVIYRATPAYNGTTNHKGSNLLFDSQGRLYVSFGEHSADDIRVQAQSLGATIGKIIRINKDGTAAAGNPFAGTAGAKPEIWSLGHRNPQGLAWNPVTGDLWESEHGPQAGDEINLIKAGGNYGWPTIAYGLEYSGAKVGNGTQQAGMEQPVYYWDPAIAPSGITFYTGSLIPEWRNNLFVAALKGMHIVRLVIKDNKVIGEERLLADQGQRFRKVVQGPDGALYAITDMAQGRIYRIGI
ncbi:PQQ-dependent sugar dehydrogenase [Mucilaginibacter boryungensis]|uniref:PQQ-dependent sugar dehydrogenase n=1 Tax=Mucilaginibacter boryungensis TaxID=768480 RepID=A0ABR9XD52_9SPHI|nr:PQQ-dependent sugar dehydrogenase [Mucilaginibacter boryungensis]MBE9665324.1 PQQ-dependent sugar dehydrogenase [Mucilaginibacter boryungensis]